MGGILEVIEGLLAKSAWHEWGMEPGYPEMNIKFAWRVARDHVL